MSDSNDHAGFSFQISETPPPARAGHRTPLAELELEMEDFGQARELSPLPPPQASDTAQRRSEAKSAWLDEPLRPPQPTTDSQPSPRAAPPLEPSPPQSRPRVASDGPQAEAALPEEDAAPIVPRIKKISFPKAAPRKSRPPEELESPKAAARTKFSKSIGAEKPRRSLDSEPEVEPNKPAPELEMAPPEDLPGIDEPLLPPAPEAAGWGTDTPSAREIWRRARGSWHAASRQAAALGSQGLRAGKALAETVNDKVKERLREAAEERTTRAQASAQGHAPAPESPPLPSVSQPSTAGKMILGLARSAGRKAAAPASALAAAALVYFAGSHFLGADASVALSKAVQGPEIPELGTVSGEEGDATSDQNETSSLDTGEKAPRSEKASSSGPPPMQTEVTEMPQGMSWPGKGLIEVVTSQDELVYVDGVFTGRGPLRRIPVTPGEHEVSIRADGKERTGSVEVQANKNTRAVFKGE